MMSFDSGRQTIKCNAIMQSLKLLELVTKHEAFSSNKECFLPSVGKNKR